MSFAIAHPTSQTIASSLFSIEQFFAFDDHSDGLYELEDGVLISMPAESEINRRIACFLLVYFAQQGISYYQLSMKTEIVTTGSRVRIPDLVLLSEQLVIALEGAKRSVVTPEMPAPLLVVEVVSPTQQNRDYRYKRSEYAARGIDEYWIVDPIAQKVTILEWVEGFYEERIYQGETAIASIILPQLTLTPSQILQA